MESLMDKMARIKTGDLTNEIHYEAKQKKQNSDIAIIGIAFRLPKADTFEDLTKLLNDHEDCISLPSEQRKKDTTAYLNYKNVDESDYDFIESAFLSDIDLFDNKFFRISAKEASLMDPYHKILLETTYHAFEDAGLTKEELKGSNTGFYLGKPQGTDYYRKVKEMDPDFEIVAGPGNIDSIMASRISYYYDLRGPSLLVDTACSSSMVALHIACNAINNDECGMAIVGGINLISEPVRFRDKEIPEVFSSISRARTFSDDTDGTGNGEGCIIYILKPLDLAIKEGNNIHTIIKASAYNNDGSSIGITAPSSRAQEEVIVKALEKSGVDPSSISYIEAHGTGTKLGDPIEFEALTQAFEKYTLRKQFCGIGSIKTNFGHLDSASGLLGILKCILTLKSRKLYPGIHFEMPNRNIDFVNSPFFHVRDTVSLNDAPYPIRCAASSFGLSGTNCHVILEEAPQLGEEDLKNEVLEDVLPILISAHDETALMEYVENYYDFICKQQEINFFDIYHTLKYGRNLYSQHLVVFSNSLSDLKSKLKMIILDGLDSNHDQGIYYNEDVQCEVTKRRGRKVSLPGYPFRRERFWLEIPENEGLAEPVKEEIVLTMQTTQSNNVLNDLKGFVANLFELDSSEFDENLSYIEMGIDSISIIQLKQELKKRYNIEISAGELFNEYGNLKKLADFIVTQLPTVLLSEPIDEKKGISYESINSSSSAVVEGIEVQGTELHNEGKEIVGLLENQLKIMSQQLNILINNNEFRGVSDNHHKVAQPKDSVKVPTIQHKPKEHLENSNDKFFQKYIVKSNAKLTDNQLNFLRELIRKYNNKTGKSMELAQKHRKVWANGRRVQGFSRDWKKIIYPIVAQRAIGSKMWDVEGNEYLDFSMGFGVNFFGYNDPEINQAVSDELNTGIILGPHTDHPGEVAKLLNQITGVERVAFCNSGTEAIMNLVRIARATTGKDIIVLFSHSFHGTFDGVYVLKSEHDQSAQAIPLSLGTTENMVKDVWVLEYGDVQSLEIIKNNAQSLAAVLVEPIQSRNPALQPKEFLHELRTITKDHDIALIFDEIITGFRVHPGGAQKYFGVEADLVAYGKIIGGGFPLGVFAGKAKYMDRIDGGYWDFHDESAPSGFVVQTGGTFSHHPTAMVAAKVVLNRILDEGERLQNHLNDRTSAMVQYLNGFLESSKIPMKIASFGSLFIFQTKDPNLLRFIYFMLIEKGIYIWEGGTCFLSTAHSDQEIMTFVKVFQEVCVELEQNHCFLFEISKDSLDLSTLQENLSLIYEKSSITEENGLNLIGNERSFNYARTLLTNDKTIEAIFPMSPMQRLVLAQNINYSGTGHEVAISNYNVKGIINANKLINAWRLVIQKHSILRTAFHWRRLSEPLQVVYKDLEIPIIELDWSHLNSSEQKENYEKWIEKEKQNNFDILSPPLIKLYLIKMQKDSFKIVIKYYNSLFDGWSTKIILTQLIQACESAGALEIEGVYHGRSDYKEYIGWLQQKNTESSKQFWEKEFQGFQTSNSKVVAARSNFTPFEYEYTFTTEDSKKLIDYCRRIGITPFTLFQGIWALSQREIQNSDDILLASVCSGRSYEIPDVDKIVGLFANVLPVRVPIMKGTLISTWLKGLQSKNMILKDHEHNSIEQISEWGDVPLSDLHNAIYTGGLVFLNYPVASSAPSSLIIEFENEDAYIHVPLRLYVAPNMDSYQMILRSDEHTFSKEFTTIIGKKIIKHILGIIEESYLKIE
ncbi:glutamate-1-semialdehyde aminotransferase/3-oxoacyl-(acyl-carrier-protein) synthase/acyl carrier protein [Paenibacillus sp. JGP012]|uniref:aminotransferase class III-fold pyridoxal phosphate-dependent enzyme n=1 Tax=Paenibacillus sp. JGP012 TaxID=2735914 RepID=UPI00161B45AF|nr:aminotransferase class III-fold pyridoxal phosphate-dependent enzyme [Paenibacillus sp. JGP012]MBB6022772.1 glutamate-1-semialdehyde aminotransferase/3-oxoacyl-(acyl-carrier-protein) synthase/acyl carrier protein [Paenibacillus sp. JGP012]